VKDQYSISPIGDADADEFFKDHHYLGGAFPSNYFFYQTHVFYALWDKNTLMGCVQFMEATEGNRVDYQKNYFGFEYNGRGIWDIGRLAVAPNQEHNLTSWFLARAIKLLRRKHEVKYLLTLADSRLHDGTIYHATNFHYYGCFNKLADLPYYDVYFHKFGITYDKEIL